jgi:hypothetical protein
VTRSRRRALIGAASALGIALLGELWFFSDGQTANRAHDDAVSLWESTEPAAYSFEFTYCGGMCMRCPTLITVEAGEVTEAASVDGECSDYDVRSAPTIEDVFAMEEHHRAAPTTDSFDIRYDPTWGFPAAVDIRCPYGWSDCGSGYEVTAFRVLDQRRIAITDRGRAPPGRTRRPGPPPAPGWSARTWRRAG